jgi:hypothetical protein
VYLRNRYYDPITALFVTVDPQVSSTGMPYAYAGDNPVNQTDLNGLCSSWNIFCEVFNRLPDYIIINGVVSLPFAQFIYVGVNVTITRYGRIFIGPEGGASVPGAMIDARAGWIDQTPLPSDCELNNFAGQWSAGASAYGAFLGGVAGPSVAETWGNPGQAGWKNFGTEVGLGVGAGHSASVGGSYDWMLPWKLPAW